MARILVIDDDAEVRRFFRQVLELDAHEVEEAADGAAGLRRLVERPAELVITDILMPGKEGLETIAEIRRQAPAVAVIAVSGGGRVPPQVYLRLARDLGVRHALTKPVDLEDLLRTVREVLAAPPRPA